jgi:hypothetical protein
LIALLRTLLGRIGLTKPAEFARTSKKGQRLTADELAMFHEGRCPDCGMRGTLLEGPHGGLSVNYTCGSPRCGSGFNEMGPFGVERISDAMPNKPLPTKDTGTAYRD